MSRKINIGAAVFVILSVGVTSSISLIGGLGIEIVEDKLLTLVPLLIALPALNSMVGDYATLIAAHAGDPEEKTRTKAELARAMLPSIVINIIFVTVLSLFLAWKRNYVLESVFVIRFVGFVVTSIASVIAVMFLLTALLEALLKNRRLNPDDVLIPIVTTITDIFMLGLIALSAVALF